MSAPRLRRVRSQMEMENLIDDYVTQGYEVIQQGNTTTLVRKKTWGSVAGHVFCALITVWFLFGLGNVGYALVAHYTAEQVMIKIETAPPQ